MVSPEGKSIIDRAKRIYAGRLQLDLERDLSIDSFRSSRSRGSFSSATRSTKRSSPP
jgi:hypothetical protein